MALKKIPVVITHFRVHQTVLDQWNDSIRAKQGVPERYRTDYCFI